MCKTAFLAFLGMVLAAGPVLAGQEGEQRFYGPSGRYEGRATPDAANDRQKSLYDASGRYVGRVMTDQDGNARVYDQHGKYVGRSSGDRMPDPKK
ncbi:MAG: hypothetical protein ACP59X_04345 [Solidesulfovibrio sp. DCME]|uniref:hypothetical protein n=1 Tax=Solidesulfovibrio sp. DCME TaxID=3447380 RepID=UPI003D117AD6